MGTARTILLGGARFCGCCTWKTRCIKPLELSGGEQQRVALARAVVNRPAIVLADEPTGNLDSENSALVLKMFRELNDRFNQTIIMITHNPEAAAACQRVIQMRDGHIV